MEYEKIPVRIQAFQFGIDPYPEWFKHALSDGSVKIEADYCTIQTREGKMMVYPGNFIIQGTKKEISACRQDIFSLTYRQVRE